MLKNTLNISALSDYYISGQWGILWYEPLIKWHLLMFYNCVIIAFSGAVSTLLIHF